MIHEDLIGEYKRTEAEFHLNSSGDIHNLTHRSKTGRLPEVHDPVAQARRTAAGDCVAARKSGVNLSVDDFSQGAVSQVILVPLQWDPMG